MVGIKQCSYFDVCENMKRYVRQLEDEKKVLEGLMGQRGRDEEENRENVLNLEGVEGESGVSVG